jgi:hypothetical protein
MTLIDRTRRPSIGSIPGEIESQAKTMSSKDHDLIIAEIHQAINKLGGSAQPATPDEAQRALRDLGADIDLRSIVDSWQDTLPDEDILQIFSKRARRSGHYRDDRKAAPSPHDRQGPRRLRRGTRLITTRGVQMFNFTDAERAYLNEMRAITTNPQGQEVLVGLTEEETAFYMTHTRQFLTERRDRDGKARYLELHDKHERGRFAVLGAGHVLRTENPPRLSSSRCLGINRTI